MHKEELASTITSYIIVAVIFIGIIVLIGFMIRPAKVLAKDRDEQRQKDLTKLETSINLYLADDKNFDNLVSGRDYDSLNPNASLGGSGWFPINFLSVSSGVPITTLPLDPLNKENLYYRIGVNVANKTYEINCRFEDYSNQLKQENDKGNATDWYEIGTDLTILN
jgi:hypothetical protein